MARGDHIYVNCTAGGIPYQHHGIDMGDETVIHLAPADGSRIAFSDTSDRFSVRRDTRAAFCRGATAVIVVHAGQHEPETVATTAESQVGRCGYCLLDGNCEHFARLCACGRAESHQIEMGQATVAAVASMTAKAFWSATGRFTGGFAVRTALKVHPSALLADGVEIAALAIGCRRGMSTEKARRVARVSGSVAAAGLGAVVGGPLGAACSLAAHSSSTAIGQRVTQAIRHALKKGSVGGATLEQVPQKENTGPTTSASQGNCASTSK